MAKISVSYAVEPPVQAAKDKAPRRVRQGDTVASLRRTAAARAVAGEAVQAAQGKQVASVLGLMHNTALSATERAEALRVTLAGASPDDLLVLQQALAGHGTVTPELPKTHSDDELASDWRDGGYP